MMIPGNELGILILNALGENPKEVVGVTLRFRANELPRIIIQKLVIGVNEQGKEITRAFERYELKKKDANSK